jgi:putative PIN family toxin of toxin-antitoxin system
MQRLKRKSRVFIDANCLIAAVLSPTGGSFALIEKAFKGEFELYLSEYVLEETFSVLKEKYPQNLIIFNLLIGKIKYKLLPEPTQKEVEGVIQYIDFKDAPVLAAAIKGKVDFLITLDKKHFIENPKLKKMKLPFKIMSPGDFLELWQAK